MADDIVELKLRQLADRFLGSLAADIGRLRPGSADDSTKAEVRMILHRLAGRAGTFGFPEIGAKASCLEAMILEGGWPSSGFESTLTELETLSADVVGRKP